MTVVGVLAVAAALILLVSGPGKIRTPAPTVAALRSLGVPLPLRRPWLVRAGGLAEIVVALAVVVAGGRVAAALLALAFAIFTAVAARLVITRATVDCGCFGSASAPVGPTHLVLTGAGTVVGVLAAVAPADGVRALFADGVAAGVAAALLAVTLAAAGCLAVTALPLLDHVRAEVIP